MFATDQKDLTDSIIRMMDTKKLKEVVLYGSEDKGDKLTSVGAALIASHANTLEVLGLYNLDLAKLLLGNKPLINLKELELDGCSGSLDSVLGNCKNLQILQM